MPRPRRQRSQRSDRDSSDATSALEAIAALGSAALLEPLSGYAGLFGLATGGLAKGVNNTNAVNSKMYQPHDPKALDQIASLMQPVGEAYMGAKEFLGDKTMDITGSPTASTIAYNLPEVLGGLFGIRQMIPKRMPNGKTEMVINPEWQALVDKGFDMDNTYYHGTPYGFDNVDKNSYVSSSPEVKPVHIRPGKVGTIEDIEREVTSQGLLYDEDFPWVHIDQQLGDVDKEMAGQYNTVKFNWPADEDMGFPDSTEYKLHSADDAINKYEAPTKMIRKKRNVR